MIAIGGYLGWDIEAGESEWHPTARMVLNSGRSCLRVLLRSKRPSAVWVPYYSCDALLEPFRATKTQIRFYSLDERLGVPDPLPELEPDHGLVYINYFGLANDEVQRLSRHYGHRLWVDNTQAFFVRPKPEIAVSFNSARKFFGVPDGAYLYASEDLVIGTVNAWPRNTDYRFEHLFLRALGRIGEGHKMFQDNEKRNGGGVRRVSILGETLLSLIDYPAIANRRRNNVSYLHTHLGARNKFPATRLILGDDTVPLCYPFLPERPIAHSLFWDRPIYVPRYWDDCLRRDTANEYRVEKKLSTVLLPLPVDQQCTIAMMDQVIAAIKTAEETGHG